MDITSELDDLLRISVQIANEMISFRKHRVLLGRSAPELEGIWKYADGVIPLGQWIGDTRLYSRLYAEVYGAAESVRRETPSNRGPLCCVRVDLGDRINGVFLVQREYPAPDFSETEAYHLQLIARLLGQARRGSDGRTSTHARQLMRRLHVVLMDARAFAKDLFLVRQTDPAAQPYDQARMILAEYMRQARFVCLPDRFDPSAGPRGSSPAWRVRTAGRLVRPDRKALWTTEADSRSSPRDVCTDEDWTDRRLNRHFYVGDEDSITAKVFDTRAC